MMEIKKQGVLENIQSSMSALDILHESIIKADALLKVILSADLDNIPGSVIHDVLWLLDDLISKVRKICDKL